MQRQRGLPAGPRRAARMALPNTCTGARALELVRTYVRMVLAKVSFLLTLVSVRYTRILEQ